MKTGKPSLKQFLAGVLFLGGMVYFGRISNEIHRFDYNLQDFQRSEVSVFTISIPYKTNRNFADNLYLISFILSASSFLSAFWLQGK